MARSIVEEEDNEEENLSDCCGWTITDGGLCSCCLEHCI